MNQRLGISTRRLWIGAMLATALLPRESRSRRSPDRVWIGAMLATALLLLAGCRTDVLVDIDVDANGAGHITVEVTFDPDVLRWTPDLADLLVLDGLDGWEVSVQHEPAPGGEQLRVAAAKPFANPAELADALAEIDRPPDGSVGLFRSATFTAERDEARILYELVVTVGLDRPVIEFVHPATADFLEGELFGLPIDDIEAAAGAPLDELVTLVVHATVPHGAGTLPASGTMTVNEGGQRELRVAGEDVDTDIAAANAEAERLAARAERGMDIALLWWIVVGAVAVAVMVGALVSSRRRRSRRLFR